MCNVWTTEKTHHRHCRIFENQTQSVDIDGLLKHDNYVQ